MTCTSPFRSVRALLAVALGLALLAPLVACDSGSPAAPEGTRIIIDYQYIDGTRNTTTGDFEARIYVRVLDSVSNVPHVGVGVFFRIESGPGRFANVNAVETDDDGYAENILVATGAVEGSPVTVSAFSGESTAPSLALDVVSGSTSENLPPTSSFTVSPSSPRVNQDVEVDVSASTDSDCPSGRPTRFEVNWGDSTPITQQDFSDPTATHQYTTTGQKTITVKVIDCDGLTATSTKNVTVGT